MVRLAWCVSGALVAASCGANHLAVGSSDDAAVADAGGEAPVPPAAAAACQAYCAANPDECVDCTNPSPVMISCLLACQAEATCCANVCSQGPSVVSNCIGYRCGRNRQGGGGAAAFYKLSDSCQTAWKAYYDCLVNQSPLCDGEGVAQPGACAALVQPLAACFD